MKENRFPITKSQETLLKAIIGDKKNALDNYKKWIDSVNFVNYIDGESYMLIPALYKRLVELGYNDKNMNSYKGIYKKALYKNSLLLNETRIITIEMNKKGIPVTVLKGIPLLLHYLDDIGVRGMGDTDIVIQREHIQEAIKVLEKLGYKSDCKYDIYENLESRHSYSFSNGNNLEVDLNWLALPVSYKNIILDETRQLTYKDVTLNMLAPEDFIFQVCLHGASWDPALSIRWLFDLHVILLKETGLDWNKLLSKLEGTRLFYIFYIQFKCFNEISSKTIPEWVLNELYKKGNDRLCKKHYRFKVIRPKTIIGRIGWYGYSYHYRDLNFLEKLKKYPAHRLMSSRYDRYRDLFAAYIRKYILKRKPKRG